MKLRQNTGGEGIHGAKVETIVSSIQYSILYMPIYYYGYTYEGKDYKFFINGQNGHRHGTRPYGLGKLGKGIDQLTSLTKSILNKPSKKTVQEWKDLNNNNN